MSTPPAERPLRLSMPLPPSALRSGRTRTQMVSIRGDVDLAAAPHVAARLRLALARTRVGVIVDLTNCSLLDSAGISVLLGAKRRARERAIPMCVVAPRDGISRRALEIVGCTSTLAVVDDRLAAIAAIDRERAPLEIPAHD